MKQAQVMTWAAVMSAVFTLSGCAGTQSSADSQAIDEPLENTYWKLVALDEQPTPVVDGKREAHIVLHTQDSRVAGSTGCNRLMGNITMTSKNSASAVWPPPAWRAPVKSQRSNAISSRHSMTCRAGR